MKNAFFTFRTNLVHDLKANKERMQWFVDNSVGVITALNPHVFLTKEQLDIILRPDEMTTPGIAGAEFTS
ncbi:hypothetical protein ENUP19_0144G0014 [Entamoeba nuttalli]|uniref:Uncharacterized protein n=1 Tax=Entamoeba nuttalli TaxID=412467 RepID=A0ABQ0DKN3_9EUKA